MAERDAADLPPLPARSRTGRVPQWVMDEALGRKVETAPWRAPTSPIQPDWSLPAKRRRGRTLAVLLLILALTVGGNLAVDYFRGVPLAELGPAVGGGVPSVPGAPGRGDGPPPGYEESATPLGTPPPVPTLPEGTGYQFLAKSTSTGGPVTWSPCRPVHYVVREANQPTGGSDLLQQAIAVTSGATGLRFVSDGATDEGPSAERPSYQPDRYGKRWAPVLIAWATPAEVPDFAGDVAGEAGPARITTSAGDDTYVSGTVYLDPAKFSQALTAHDPEGARAVILHELGHLVGLAHVPDPAALMFATNIGQTAYSLGDQVGLAALGSGPCQPQA